MARSLLSIRDISLFDFQEMQSLLSLAFSKGIDCLNLSKKIHAGLLFLEPSTRTYTSFQYVLNQLGCFIYCLQDKSLSLIKGESLKETLEVLGLIGLELFVLRASCSLEEISGLDDLVKHCMVINAGDADCEHPTQALIDAFVLYDRYKGLAGLDILFLGDVFFSRVARSQIYLFNLLGASIYVYSYPYHSEKRKIYERDFPWIHWLNNRTEALKLADIVMCFRLQEERIKGGIEYNKKIYYKDYSIQDSDEHFFKKTTSLMHPGPVIGGDYLLKSPYSLVKRQVYYSSYVRAVLIKYLYES